MDTLIILFCFVGLGIFVLVATEIRERKRQTQSPTQPIEIAESNDEGCCGAHLVCEKETLLNSNGEIEYYDDEELDSLAGINPDEFNENQHQMIADVFYSLKEKDVPGWCRSLQLREISLPDDIREEALLIVRERRNIK